MISKSLFVYLFGLSACFTICNAAALQGEEIQGGEYAESGQFKYQVGLQDDGQIACGGGIISDSHVLTAAHCVVDDDGEFNKSPLKALVGTSDLKKQKELAVLADVEKIYVPKGYSPFTNYGDIAILKLKKSLDVESNPNLSKLNLPDPKETYADKEAVIAGFGWTYADIYFDKNSKPIEMGGSETTKLKFAETDIIDRKRCEGIYRHSILSSQICARVKQYDIFKPEGVCSGDSGGPLVYNEDTVIGVVSNSPIGCTELRAPGVYTRVSSWLDFIDKAINDVKSSDINTYTFSESSSQLWWKKLWPFGSSQ